MHNDLIWQCNIFGNLNQGHKLTPLGKFWEPLYISGTAEATNFKFGVHIDYKEYCPKMQYMY